MSQKNITSIDSSRLDAVSGGFLGRGSVQPGRAEAWGAFFEHSFLPIRMMGAFAPRTARMLGAAAQMRHDLWVNTVLGGDKRAHAVHRDWIKKGYGEFAPKD